MASVKLLSFPTVPRSGLVAGEVVKVRQKLFSISVSPAGRGGEGGSWWLWAFRFWWWLCWWSSAAFLLQLAVVVWGAGAGKLQGAADGGPGRRRAGGKKGGAGKMALWPCVFIGIGFRRGAADGFAVFYKEWRCSFPGGRWYGGSGVG